MKPFSVYQRDVGRSRHLGPARAFESPANIIVVHINAIHNMVFKMTEQLRLAMESKKWPDIELAVTDLINKLLDGSDQAYHVTPTKQQEREFFVHLGGVDLILRLFEKPFSDPDARTMTASHFSRRSMMWNEVLVILREVAYAVPGISSNIFGTSHIVFLFTLLSHASVFENTMNLLEEILSLRIDTFSLSLVPNFYSLVQNFSSRHLAHFCRVLSLVLFEAEDRNIMEGAQVLKSIELLQLRRDRMTKSGNVIEQNQCIVIEMPNFLLRLLQILRVLNYGPGLVDLLRHNIVTQSSLTTDILQLMTRQPGDAHEWGRISNLINLAGSPSADHGGDGTAESVSSPSPSASQPRDLLLAATSNNTVYALPSATPHDATSAVLNDLLSMSNGDINELQAIEPRAGDISNLVNVLQYAQSLGVFEAEPPVGSIPTNINTPSHIPAPASILTHAAAATSGTGAVASGFAASSGSSSTESMRTTLGNTSEGRSFEHADLRGGRGLWSSAGRPSSRASFGGASGSAQSPQSGKEARQARKTLRLQALLLAPHQIEMLFVLCTLLSGRRKIYVQQRCAALGISDILVDMFSRMSWEAPPFQGQNLLEHLHGPDCECNPESALRVQYLRLVHNFYDRDFIQNPNKQRILSDAEKNILTSIIDQNSDENESIASVTLASEKPRGLLTLIVDTLMKEAPESIYRFWLASCLEAYLRGSAGPEQMLVARLGTLEHIVKHIAASGVRSANNLQTAFDLLGEMSKNNPQVLRLTESILTAADDDDVEDSGDGNGGTNNGGGTRFQRFIDVMMSNLIDSNVLLRSWYLTLYRFDTPTHSVRTTTAAAAAEGETVEARILAPRINHSYSTLLRSRPGYITHTWVQFQPPFYFASVVPDERTDIGDTASAARGAAAEAKISTASSSASISSSSLSTSSLTSSISVLPLSSSTSALSMSTLGDGVRGAFMGLRDVAAGLLNRSPQMPGDAASLSSVSSSNVTTNVSNNCSDSTSVAASQGSMNTAHVDHLSSLALSRTDTADSSCPRNAQGGGDDAVDVIGDSSITGVRSSSPCTSTFIYARAPLQQSQQQSSAGSVTAVGSGHYSQYGSGNGGDADHDDIMYSTPPECPRYASTSSSRRGGVSVPASPILTAPPRFGEIIPDKFPPPRRRRSPEPAEPLKKTTAAASAESLHEGELDGVNASVPHMFPAGEYSQDLLLPGSPLFSFLMDNHDKILLKLMSIVTVRSINHENICCVNSALLLLLLAQHSGRLADVLRRVSLLADGDGSTDCEGKNADAVSCSSPSSIAAATGNPPSVERRSNSQLVWMNFRELLWFWREYYLRRGRDRLSIEFSSHIPFHIWVGLVDVLCRDDDAPTSLSHTRAAMPCSPYRRLPRSRCA